MLDRWIEITMHYDAGGSIVYPKLRFESISSFCDWVDEAFSLHVRSNSDIGMYIETRNWAGGDAYIGVLGEYWHILLGVPDYPSLMFPLCDPTKETDENRSFQYLGEVPMLELLDRAVAIDSLAQWMQRGFVWLCPWSLFSDREPD